MQTGSGRTSDACRAANGEFAKKPQPGDALALIDLVFGASAVKNAGEEAENAEDKRGASRQQVLLPALIYSESLGPYRCVIRDLSASGARLSLSRTARLMSEMLIKISGKRARSARCIRRKADKVGLRFK